MPTQVPRARANLMTGKDLNKVQNEEVVIQLCKEILPRVGETFCAYKEIERVYLAY